MTRPRERSEALCFLLEDEGAEVVAVPFLELRPPTNPRPLAAAAEAVHRYTWLLLTSPSAVDAVVEAARVAGTAERLRRLRCAVVGPATARAARRHGLEVHLEAARSTGEGLFAALRPELSDTDELLLPAAEEGRLELSSGLAGAGLRFTRVAAYRSEPSPEGASARSALLSRPPQVVVFGSPRTAEAFLEALGEEGPALARASASVAIGPTTAEALAGLGWPCAAVADQPTTEGLAEAVIRAVRR